MSSLYDPARRRTFPLFSGNELAAAAPAQLLEPAASVAPPQAPAPDYQSAYNPSQGAPAESTDFEPPPILTPYKTAERGPLDRVMGWGPGRSKLAATAEENRAIEAQNRDKILMWEARQRQKTSRQYVPIPGAVDQGGHIGLLDYTTGKIQPTNLTPHDRPDTTMTEWEFAQKDPEAYKEMLRIKGEMRQKYGADTRTTYDAMRELYHGAGKTDADLINDLNTNKALAPTIRAMAMSFDPDPNDPLAPPSFNAQRFNDLMGYALGAAGRRNAPPPPAGIVPGNYAAFEKEWVRRYKRKPNPAEIRVWRQQQGQQNAPPAQ